MNKKLIFALLLLLLVADVFGATYAVDRGAKFFSGEIYFEKGFGDAYDSIGITLAPGFHYFLFRRFSLGIDLHLEHYEYEGIKYNNHSGYFMLQYFMGKKTGLIFPYAGLGVGYGNKSYSSVNYNFIGMKIAAGICFLFNDYIGLKTIASYNIENVDLDSSSSNKKGGKFYIGLGVTLFIF